MPPSLALETSWATTSITSFIRSALTFQVRKRVADVLREHLPDADDFLPPPISKPPRLHLIKVRFGKKLPRLGGVTLWLPACCLFPWFAPHLFLYKSEPRENTTKKQAQELTNSYLSWPIGGPPRMGAASAA